MDDFEQMELDLRLDYEKSLKDNIQTVVRFNIEKYQEEVFPSPVKNHHEGYGILSEKEAELVRSAKQVSADMSTFLKLLPNGEIDAINTCSSIYNSCINTAVAAVQMATQAKRILDDLYNPATPIEQTLAEAEAAGDGFENVGSLNDTDLESDDESEDNADE